MKFPLSWVLVGALCACSDATFKDNDKAAARPADAIEEEKTADAVPGPVFEEQEAEAEVSQVNPEFAAKITEEAITTKEIGSQIPGVSTVKVGVNFEDKSIMSDKDYNDAVLCFQGYFKVDQARVVSAIDQTIVATSSSISGCSHTVEVVVAHANGTAEKPVTYNSRVMGPVNLTFKTGDRLIVSITALEAECDAGVVRKMDDPNFARVQIGVCNTSGK